MDARERLWQRGFRYALALCGDANQAEDLLHEGWVSTMRARGDAPVGYLLTAIRSRWIDGWRKEQRQPVVSLLTEPVSAGPGPEALASDRERVAWALEQLRPAEREVLFLAAVEGHTAAEIAELTGRPRGTVLSLLHRGRQRVRAAVELESAKEVTG